MQNPHNSRIKLVNRDTGINKIFSRRKIHVARANFQQIFA